MFKLDKVPGMQSFLLLMVLGLVTSQNNPQDSAPNQNRRRTTSDPVSNFFSELGDLILDVDQTIAIQSQPKIEREANIVSQLFRPSTDYFDRIQKNYKDMQKRIGKLIGDTIGLRDTYSEHELSTVSPPVDKFIPTIEPDYNPFAAAAEARKGKMKEKFSKGTSYEHPDNKNPVRTFKPVGPIPKSVPESLKAFSKISKAIVEDIRSATSKSYVKEKMPKERMRSSDLEECSNEELLEDPVLEQRRKERCSHVTAEKQARGDSKVMLDPKLTSEALFSATSKALDQLSEGFLARSGNSLAENPVSIDENDSETKENSEMSRDECLDEVLEDAVLENLRKEKCARIAAEEKLIKDLNKLVLEYERLVSGGSKVVDELSMLMKRSGDAEDERLGEVLSSDSFFDKHIRQLVKDHGSWILDYPLLKRWRQRERSSDDKDVRLHDSNSKETESMSVETTSDESETETTEIYIPVTTEMALQKSGEVVTESPHQSSYYRIVNEDGDVMEEEIDFVLDPESLSHINTVERLEPKETVILAFTSDGVPLKVRLGPEIDNPLQYLHKVLQSASVSLNIPVESYDDLEPVGKEVLKLGSGILTRAVLINASNPNELKSLLKALMVSKSSGKTTF